MKMEYWSILFVVCLFVPSNMGFVNIEDFFPEIKGNLTKVVWAHAVNNATYLNNTLLNQEIMMIEADVQLGTLTTNTNTTLIPIMAHSPDNTSDLSLETFLMRIDEHNKKNETGITKKGIKLDFKQTGAFLNSLSILNSISSQANYPLWINADILQGPINAITTPVNASDFLENVKAFPDAWLSLGWTTQYGAEMTGAYSEQNINEMINTIKQHNVTNHITFPVRAGLAMLSIEPMMKLLNETSQNNSTNSTLTIWSAEKDNISILNIRKLIATAGVERVFIDVPDDLKSQLRLNELTNSAVHTFVASLPLVIVLFSLVF